MTYDIKNPGGWSAEKDYSVSAIRFISLIMIIMCHIFQYYQLEAAWWLNVGVQIFICISGYLYGQRRIKDTINYYKHRFIKILTPYYIVFLIAGILQFLFAHDQFSWLSFGGGLFCRTTIEGGGHLWFISLILMCYVITPLLDIYKQKYSSDLKSLMNFGIVSIVIASITFGLFFSASALSPAWISCYIIGYILGIISKKEWIKIKWFVGLFMILAILGNGIQCYIDYYKKIEFTETFGMLYGYFQNYNHVWRGIFLFLSLKAMLDKGIRKKNVILDITDKYSYEVYLVHQFFILGPFSLMEVTSIVGVNILIIILLIVSFAWILKKVAAPIVSVIETR